MTDTPYDSWSEEGMRLCLLDTLAETYDELADARADGNHDLVDDLEATVRNLRIEISNIEQDLGM